VKNDSLKIVPTIFSSAKLIAFFKPAMPIDETQIPSYTIKVS
jgi:hypothetical protein